MPKLHLQWCYHWSHQFRPFIEICTISPTLTIIIYATGDTKGHLAEPCMGDTVCQFAQNRDHPPRYILL